MPAKTLNDSFLKTGLICPPTKNHIEFTSDDRSGLYIEVRSTSQGQGTYWFRFKAKDTGKTARVKIGRSTDITIREAKEQVKILRAKIQLGTDLAGETRKKKEVMTWNELMKLYLPHAHQHLRSAGNLDDMHRLRVGKRWGEVQLNKFSRREVQQWLNELRESGLAAATVSHHGKFIRQALNLAVEWDLVDSNPVAGLKLFAVDNRVENVMTDEQLQQLIATLQAAGDRRKVASLAIRFLLFTGARVNEALHARWSDIDRKTRTWTVLATNSKSKRRRSIPLNDAAMAVLDKLDSEGSSEWLFTSSRGDGTARMTTINKMWQAIRKDAGLPWLRLHDLRHNYASMLVNSGRTLYEVQQILGHSDSKVTERYAHLSTASLQDAANSASDYMDKALKDTSK